MMRPDYDDTEWRKLGMRHTGNDDWEMSGPPWWSVLIGALIMLAIPAMLVWCVVG